MVWYGMVQYAALGYNLWSLSQCKAVVWKKAGVPGMMQFATLGFVVTLFQCKTSLGKGWFGMERCSMLR